jgi:hypothetical protein
MAPFGQSRNAAAFVFVATWCLGSIVVVIIIPILNIIDLLPKPKMERRSFLVRRANCEQGLRLTGIKMGFNRVE